MKFYWLSISILALILCSALLLPSFVYAQHPNRNAAAGKPSATLTSAQFDSGKSSLGIPLEVDNNIILLRVSVNNSKPLRFIFDTGASSSAISSKRAAELGLKSQGQVRADATGGTVEGSAIGDVELSVRGAKVSNLTIVALPLPAPPGFEFDGIIGCDFIRQFVVEIDYLKKTINLYNPLTYRYRGRGASIPLILIGENTPLARVRIFLAGRAPVAARLEVDTGGDNTIIINSPFVKRHNLAATIRETNPYTRNGVGGEQKVIVGLVKAVGLGRFTLRNLPVALSLDTEGVGASEENDGLIGGEILRRFKVVFDYSRKKMILEPNKNFNSAYNLESGDD